MAVTQVTVRELLQITEGDKNVEIQTLRTSIDNANRKLIGLQRDLQNLKSSYWVVLQNINRNLRRKDLELLLSPDRFQTTTPEQSIRTYDPMTQDPDPRINRIQRLLGEGNEIAKVQLNKLEQEIKVVNQSILNFTTQKESAVKQLAEIKDANIITARDNIAKSQYETVYMLYEIYQRYRDLSTDSSSSRKFSSSAPIATQYQLLSQTFKAYAERDPDVLKGNLKLLLEDPGCDENGKALNELLERRAKVLADNKDSAGNPIITSDMKKNVDLMFRNINDGHISQNVSRQNDMKRTPRKGNAFNELTATIDHYVTASTNAINNVLSGLSPTGKPVQIFGVNLNSVLDASYFSDAITSKMRREMIGLYDGMPLCSDTTKSENEQAMVKDQKGLAKAEESASLLIASQFSNAARKVTKSNAEAMNSLGNSYAEVDKAIRSPKNSNTSDYTLTIERKTYTSKNQHDSFVLNNARLAYDKATSYRINQDILEEDYQKYIEKIQGAIESGTACNVEERKY
jgi:hypothetical protein